VKRTGSDGVCHGACTSVERPGEDNMQASASNRIGDPNS
jgi:hypothetical protein